MYIHDPIQNHIVNDGFMVCQYHQFTYVRDLNFDVISELIQPLAFNIFKFSKVEVKSTILLIHMEGYGVFNLKCLSTIENYHQLYELHNKIIFYVIHIIDDNFQ